MCTPQSRCRSSQLLSMRAGLWTCPCVRKLFIQSVGHVWQNVFINALAFCINMCQSSRLLSFGLQSSKQQTPASTTTKAFFFIWSQQNGRHSSRKAVRLAGSRQIIESKINRTKNLQIIQVVEQTSTGIVQVHRIQV